MNLTNLYQRCTHNYLKYKKEYLVQTGGALCKAGDKFHSSAAGYVVNNGDILLLRSISNGRYMNPAGGVDKKDTLYENPCFRTFRREFHEEVGVKLPDLENLKKYTFVHDNDSYTRMYVGWVSDEDRKTITDSFTVNSEADEIVWASLKELKDNNYLTYQSVKIRNVVTKSLKEMDEKGFFER